MKIAFHRRAFTLIEMALILVLFGVVLSTTMPKLLSEMRTDKAKRSKASVREARDELVGFAIVNEKLPSPDTSGADPVVPTSIKARTDTWDEGIVYILPNTSVTGASVDADSICGIDSTEMSVVTPAGTTEQVAFVIASKGLNLQRDFQYDASGGNGDPRTVTLQGFGEDSNLDGERQYDDVADFVTLEYLKSKVNCDNYTPTPPGTPDATFSLDDDNDTNLQAGTGASTVSPTTAGGGIGNVLELDGTADGAVTVQNSADYRYDTFTIMGWFKSRNAAYGDYEPIITRQQNTNWTNRNFWVVLWANNTTQNHVQGEVVFKASRNDGSTTAFADDTDAQTRLAAATYRHHDAEWHFFAVTMDDGGLGTASPHTVTTYVSDNIANDLYVTPLTHTENTQPVGPELGPATGAGVYDMYIGKEEGSGRYFDGYIDEIVIYDYVLTATEIGKWYNSTKPFYN